MLQAAWEPDAYSFPAAARGIYVDRLELPCKMKGSSKYADSIEDGRLVVEDARSYQQRHQVWAKEDKVCLDLGSESDSSRLDSRLHIVFLILASINGV